MTLDEGLDYKNCSFFMANWLDTGKNSYILKPPLVFACNTGQSPAKYMFILPTGTGKSWMNY